MMLRRWLAGGIVLLLLSCAAENEEVDGEALPTSPEDICPILVGYRVPNVTLKTKDGSPVDLSALLAEKPAIMVFYRGGW